MVISTIFTNIFVALKEIGSSFFKDSSLWWLLAPIILLWVLIEIYFGLFKNEKLGWNTALGNGITLLWISIESIRSLFSLKPDSFVNLLILVIVILIYSLFVIILAFSHKVRDNTEFFLAGANQVYFLALISVLFGHGVLNISLWVLIDLVIIYLIISLFFFIVRKFIPESKKEIGISKV